MLQSSRQFEIAEFDRLIAERQEHRLAPEYAKLRAIENEMSEALDALHKVGAELGKHPEIIERCTKALKGE
jgi:hypothetical protein